MRARLAATAFGLNAAWEVAHWPLYDCAWSPPVIVQAATVDAAITVGVAEGASVLTHKSDAGFWPALVTGLGGAALAIELWALRRERRLYAGNMPRLAGVGLTPLAQLPLLGVAAVKLVEGGQRGTAASGKGRAEECVQRSRAV